MDTGLTLEDQQIQGRHYLKKLGIPLRDLQGKDLEEEINKFLARTQCLSLATVNPDGTPHQTILDYQSSGLDIWIGSQGGQKFINLDKSNRVAVAIGFTAGTVESEYGLTMDGVAKVYKMPHPKFGVGMLKLKNFLEEWTKSVQPLENMIKRVVGAWVIKIEPVCITYMNLPDGVIISQWEK